ncbi:hypothetical protein SFRURICE_018155 [Spodoptera frugiperda]|uniref:SFRICE_010185 n=1 Tax=Spodoptera frugiperda TaxID=7108 RepID=A0A2H1WL03_SPOFR|nr:hypothetical protein SFRURICE_018155 [Spodoptera frugiperda]
MGPMRELLHLLSIIGMAKTPKRTKICSRFHKCYAEITRDHTPYTIIREGIKTTFFVRIICLGKQYISCRSAARAARARQPRRRRRVAIRRLPRHAPSDNYSHSTTLIT